MPLCRVHRLGLVPYRDAWELQKRLAADRAADSIPDTLLLLEHPPIYTLGRSGHAENLLWNVQELAARGVEVEWVDRGGDITFHGPGQLVGYPILKLGKPSGESGRLPSADYIGYVRCIEEILMGVLLRFGIVAGQLNGLTGVWIQPDLASRCAHCPPGARLAPSKIAAIGVKVDARGVSQHGFALNVAPDMSYFDGIIPCGIGDHGVLSMADLLDDAPGMEAVMDVVGVEFGRVFERQMVAAGATSDVMR